MRAGARVRPAKDMIASTPGVAASSAASAVASDVPPRTRTRIRLSPAFARLSHDGAGKTMADADRHRRGRRRRPYPCRARGFGASLPCRRRRAASGARRSAGGEGDGLAFSDRRRRAENSGEPGRAGRRAGVGRSLLLWRRNAARRACWTERDGLLSRALGVQPRRRAAALEPAGRNAHFAAWPRFRAHHPRAAAGRQDPLPLLGRNDGAAHCETALRTRSRPLQNHSA